MLADGGAHSTALRATPALATHCASTDNVYHSVLLLTATFFLFFSPFPSLLSSLAGGIKFNCIVYDRYRVRFGTNSRQTVHSVHGAVCVCVNRERERMN